MRSMVLYVFLEPTRLGEDFWRRALPALSADRQQKVLRFRFARDRVLSAVAYLLLRLGLGREYGMSGCPECVFGPYGKPSLRNGKAGFSLSHCHQAVVCALDRGEVGADVEHWTSFAPERLDTGMLERIFAPEELKAVQAASNGPQAACALWTAKESVCKYTGEGLRDDLPLVLRRTDVRVDTYGFGGRGLCAAVCRRARAGLAPLPRQVVTAGALRDFLRQCLNGTKGGKTGA